MLDIWSSFRRLPVWVQLWMALWLGPVNMAPLLFLDQPYALWVAALSVGGMLPNIWILHRERGFSGKLALPHVIFWSPLVLLLAVLLRSPEVSGAYRALLWILLITDMISLGFDLRECWHWWRGKRGIS